MSDLFKLILSMSLSGSMLILLLFFLKPLYKERFSKAWQYYIWLIVLFRLVVPYSPEFGLVNGLFRETQARSAAVAEASAPSASDQTVSVGNSVESDGKVITLPAASENPSKASPDVWKIAGELWLAGACLLFAWKAAQYARFAREIRGSARAVAEQRLTALSQKTAAEMKLKREPPAYESTYVQSPMLMGICSSAVFLPETAPEMDDVSICYVFRHELTHFKRRDLLYKWIVQLILCVHWFNPLVYFMRGHINRLCELSCDEAIAKDLNTEAKKEYGSTLLCSISESRKSALTTTFCEDKKNLKERLSTILKVGRKSKKLIFISILASVLLFSTGICLGAFSAQTNGSPNSVPSGQADQTDKPYLTWEALKELAEGSLSYSDLSDAYASQDIGSGMYVLCYPVGDADFSLIVSTAAPGKEPVSASLSCESADLRLTFNAENLGIMMELYNSGDSQKISDLFQKEIPVPDGAKTYGNLIYMTGEEPDTVMTNYRKMLGDGGWELTQTLGTTGYYRKGVQGNELFLSVSCPQEGQTRQSDVTLIRFALEPAPSEDERERAQSEQDVRALVENFGQTMKMVPLVAQPEEAAESIGTYYADYVTPELLEKWQAEPENALGRVGSSPWPERIDILSMEWDSDTEYTVYGEVIELDSELLAQGEIAGKQPVTLTVEKTDGRFRISGAVFGEYEKQGPIFYENTEYGFQFYLPETWKGYSIIEEQWQSAEARNAGTESAQTGPEILIRNPNWTQENPYQDIPIMVFTTQQWDAVQSGVLIVSAAPVGPSKLGSNSDYVFALPPRYNFAFPTGYEEVEKIISGNPLWVEEVNS